MSRGTGAVATAMVGTAAFLRVLGPGPVHEEMILLAGKTVLLLPPLILLTCVSRSFIVDGVVTLAAVATVWWSGILWVAFRYNCALSAMKRTFVVSLVPIAVGMLVSFAITLATRGLRKRRAVPPGHCHKCKYDLAGNTSGICPECGSPWPATEPQRAARGLRK